MFSAWLACQNEWKSLFHIQFFSGKEGRGENCITEHVNVIQFWAHFCKILFLIFSSFFFICFHLLLLNIETCNISLCISWMSGFVFSWQRWHGLVKALVVLKILKLCRFFFPAGPESYTGSDVFILQNTRCWIITEPTNCKKYDM